MNGCFVMKKTFSAVQPVAVKKREVWSLVINANWFDRNFSVTHGIHGYFMLYYLLNVFLMNFTVFK